MWYFEKKKRKNDDAQYLFFVFSYPPPHRAEDTPLQTLCVFLFIFTRKFVLFVLALCLLVEFWLCCGRPQHFKHHRNSTRRRQRASTKSANSGVKMKKKRNFWTSHFLGPAPFGPQLFWWFCFCCWFCRCFWGRRPLKKQPLPLVTFQNVKNNFTIDETL